MIPNFPSVIVTEEPADMLMTGLAVTTTMKKSKEDCPDLWAKFVHRVHEALGTTPRTVFSPSYGISVMQSEDEFEYWATVPSPASVAIPEGMKQTTIKAGLYVATTILSLAHIDEAYMMLYGQWAQESTEYELDYSRGCFEKYDIRFTQSGLLELHIPVKKRM